MVIFLYFLNFTDTTALLQIWVMLIWIVTFFAGALPLGLIYGFERKNRSSPTPDARRPFCTVKSNW